MSATNGQSTAVVKIREHHRVNITECIVAILLLMVDDVQRVLEVRIVHVEYVVFGGDPNVEKIFR